MNTEREWAMSGKDSHISGNEMRMSHDRTWVATMNPRVSSWFTWLTLPPSPMVLCARKYIDLMSNDPKRRQRPMLWTEDLIAQRAGVGSNRNNMDPRKRDMQANSVRETVACLLLLPSAPSSSQNFMSRNVNVYKVTSALKEGLDRKGHQVRKGKTCWWYFFVEKIITYPITDEIRIVMDFFFPA